MMREIKFRQLAYNADVKDRWHYWGFGIDGNIFTGPISTVDAHEYSQQFTGLKDKNGKEIYEGDIVKTTVAHQTFGGRLDLNVPPDIKVFVVRWGEFSTGFNLIKTNINTYEVIGNIYENPELLREKG